MRTRPQRRAEARAARTRFVPQLSTPHPDGPRAWRRRWQVHVPHTPLNAARCARVAAQLAAERHRPRRPPDP